LLLARKRDDGDHTNEAVTTKGFGHR
jgi:hypothetical protein